MLLSETNVKYSTIIFTKQKIIILYSKNKLENFQTQALILLFFYLFKNVNPEKVGLKLIRINYYILIIKY